VRPPLPCQVMYMEALQAVEKKEEMRRAASEAELKECTFAPKLNPQPAANGRVTQVRHMAMSGGLHLHSA
jgi:hypothetical protein